mmetsp:Transcript_11576/g.35171  ORF Transcript_11576/g.35171 Transcript_11576/m.35171 type:complete len:355 (-) Transcript_11576:752-1816(-)
MLELLALAVLVPVFKHGDPFVLAPALLGDAAVTLIVGDLLPRRVVPREEAVAVHFAPLVHVRGARQQLVVEGLLRRHLLALLPEAQLLQRHARLLRDLGEALNVLARPRRHRRRRKRCTARRAALVLPFREGHGRGLAPAQRRPLFEHVALAGVEAPAVLTRPHRCKAAGVAQAEAWAVCDSRRERVVDLRVRRRRQRLRRAAAGVARRQRRLLHRPRRNTRRVRSAFPFDVIVATGAAGDRRRSRRQTLILPRLRVRPKQRVAHGCGRLRNAARLIERRPPLAAAPDGAARGPVRHASGQTRAVVHVPRVLQRHPQRVPLVPLPVAETRRVQRRRRRALHAHPAAPVAEEALA